MEESSKEERESLNGIRLGLVSLRIVGERSQKREKGPEGISLSGSPGIWEKNVINHQSNTTKCRCVPSERAGNNGGKKRKKKSKGVPRAHTQAPKKSDQKKSHEGVRLWGRSIDSTGSA